MAMGLTAENLSELIELDETYPAQMAERRRLLAERAGDVLAVLPGAGAACAELLAFVLELLPRRFPGFFARNREKFENRLTGESVRCDAWGDAHGKNCLAVLAGLVAEDFCLLRASAEGPLLIAAALCFPARWVLAEKLGLPLASVHARVPFYGERLAAPVDRFMRHLKPGRMAVRLNWSVIDDSSLFQQEGKFGATPDASITAENALAKLFLRVERQSFFLLPVSNVVSFAIRTHVYPLTRIVAPAGEAARLAAAIRALPEAMALYKSLPRFREALLSALDSFPSERALSVPR